MKRILTALLVSPLTAFLLSAGFAQPAYAASASCQPTPAAKQVIGGVEQASGGGSDSTCGESGVTKAIAEAVKILSFVAGVAAIIAIIFSGFKYITSGGDSGKVANAKNTLIYAVIGIAVAVLAQLIVNIVITQSIKAVHGG